MTTAIKVIPSMPFLWTPPVGKTPFFFLKTFLVIVFFFHLILGIKNAILSFYRNPPRPSSENSTLCSFKIHSHSQPRL